MAVGVGRRQFISVLGGTAFSWPFAARAEDRALPVVGFISDRADDGAASYVTAFRKGLGENGYLDGQNLTVEYRWLEGHYDRVPTLVADLVNRRVAVIVTPASPKAAAAAKAATSTIPIVFGVPIDPVQLGLVASLARPGGNVTGINFFTQEVTAKRLRLLHDLLPKAVHIAVLVNPANPSTAEPTLREVEESAPAIGLQIRIVNASTIDQIDAAFATLARERPDALLVGGDGFLFSRAVQLANLTARYGIPTAFGNRVAVAAGGLMSYGTDVVNMFHEVGEYAGKILKGAKPADLPVLQSTKFEIVLNLKTAKALGIEVPPAVLSIVDEAIE